MSEFELDEHGPGWSEEVQDFIDARDAPGPEPDSVEARYFNPDGSLRDDPEIRSPEVWAMLADEYEAEAEQVSAFDYADEWSSEPGVAEFEQRLQAEAATRAASEAYSAALVDEVRRLGASEGVRGEEAVWAVANEVEDARREWFDRQLAEGASVNQALQGLAALDVQGAIRVGLQEQRARSFADRDPSLRMWRQGRAAVAEERAREGRSPLPSDVMSSPSMQRMQRQSAAYVERVQKHRELQRQANARAAGRWWEV